MDVFDAIKKRRSIREYLVKPIPTETLERIVDAGRFAATARNVQPWEFIVITEAPVLKKLAALSENASFLQAAAACIAVYSCDTKYYLEDGCAATQNMLIAAAALGIGTCWVAGDKKPYCAEVSKFLNVPSGFKLVSLISLGFSRSDEAFKLKEKRPLNEVLHWEKF